MKVFCEGTALYESLERSPESRILVIAIVIGHMPPGEESFVSVLL